MVRKEEEKDILEANCSFLFLEMLKSKKNDSIKEKEVATRKERYSTLISS